MVSALRSAAKAGALTDIDPGAVSALLDALMAEEWVVYAKPCLEHTASLIGYLARYTHRIALSNARIQGLDDDQVSLSYRDHRDGEHKTLAPIDACPLFPLSVGLRSVVLALLRYAALLRQQAQPGPPVAQSFTASSQSPPRVRSSMRFTHNGSFPDIEQRTRSP